jgi:concanavalin A-like lectin/glucanase superfamily protein/fibronectin type III domain protein
MRNRLILILVLAGLSLGLAPTAFAAPQYPDLTTLPPRDLRFDRADVSQDLHGDVHNVLRFTNTVWNNGGGRLELRATINPNTKDGAAVQRLYDDSGGFSDTQVGRFYYHAVHAHYHYDDWGRYQLWKKADYDAWVASGRTQGQPEDIGTKTTSCIMDEEFIKTLPATPYPAVFPSNGCQPDAQGFMIQGLSPGWGDTYDYYRFEQWIDLGQANLADGAYVLRSVTDPLNKIIESPNKADDSKESPVANEGVIRFTVSAGKIVDSAKPTGTARINDIAAKTSSPAVTVKVLGRDDVSGVKFVRLSNNGTTWTAPKTYTGSGSSSMAISWDLTDPAFGGTSADGMKTVYVQFQDATGQWSDSVTDTILLDRGGSGGGTATPYTAAVTADSPAGFWRLGETSGTTAADFTGAFPGTYLNAPTLGVAGLLPAESDRAVRFDGTNDYVRVADAPGLNPAAQVSVEAWIRPDVIPAAGTFASVVSKPEAYSLQFNGPKLEFTLMRSGARYRTQAPAGAVAAGQSYHVVGTYDGARTHLYLNGTEVASIALTGAVGSSTSSLSFGSWSGSSERFTGTIDEVAVYAKALSAARVQAHRSAAMSSDPTVLAPTDPLATPASSTAIDLSWTDNSNNEAEFVVERDTDPQFTAAQATIVPANTTHLTVPGLNPSTTYYFRVRARNATTSSGWTNNASATTFAAVATPTGLSATAISASQVNLQWTDNSSNETQFVIQRDTSPSFPSPVTKTTGANVTSFQDTGLPAATTFYYCVLAKNATDSSGRSNTATATTQGGAPPPSGYSATVAADQPVSHWRLGEASGTVAADQKNANPGTYVNGVVLGAASLLGTDTANKAITLDGANDQVRIPSSPSLNLAAPFTLEAWIKPAKLPAAGQFASVLTKAESYSLQFNGPRLEFTIMQFGVRQRLQAPVSAVVAGQTYHVVATFDGTTRRLYLNGVEVASAALSGGPSSSTNNAFVGSWNGSSEFLAGTVDEAAVYNTALSAARVAAHYNAGH